MQRISSRIIPPFLYPVAGRIPEITSRISGQKWSLYIKVKKIAAYPPSSETGYGIWLDVRYPAIVIAGYPAKSVSPTENPCQENLVPLILKAEVLQEILLFTHLCWFAIHLAPWERKRFYWPQKPLKSANSYTMWQYKAKIAWDLNNSMWHNF